MCVCFITAGPITKLFAWGGGQRRVEDMCYERRRAEACVDESAHQSKFFYKVKNLCFLDKGE